MGWAVLIDSIWHTNLFQKVFVDPFRPLLRGPSLDSSLRWSSEQKKLLPRPKFCHFLTVRSLVLTVEPQLLVLELEGYQNGH